MSFDLLAPFYDLLARSIFGKKLFCAKTFFVPHLQSCKTLFIIGGGTGEALNFILSGNPELEITFVEPSKGMIRKARRRLQDEFRPRVHFIQGDHNDIPQSTFYDAIILFFVLDSMNNQTNSIFLKEICSHLNANGMILVADFFHAEDWKKNLLTWIMYRFFILTTGMEANKLPGYKKLFDDLSLAPLSTMSWQNGYIRSMVLQKK